MLKEKIEAISKFKFSKMLKNLKAYLDLTEWLYNYVSMYTQVAGPL